MTFRNKASFGKRIEAMVEGELLRRGYDVYAPRVDDMGIDLAIRVNSQTWIEVQIKGRSREAKPIHAGRYSNLRVNPRPNYLYIFYCEHLESYWIIPSEDLVKISYRRRDRGTFNLKMSGTRKGAPYALERFDEYRNERGWEKLRVFIEESGGD